MDGNGRWAKKRLLPRVAGHRRGLETVRRITRCCIEAGVEYLTLFAFSSENWRRPADEVSFLMQLFMRALESEVAKLHQNNIRLKVVGDLHQLRAAPGGADPRSGAADRGQHAPHAHDRGQLRRTLGHHAGGQPPVQGASRRMWAASTRRIWHPIWRLAFAPEPDLFIRTGGEQRVSNFCLWQLAYTELYFTDTLWPDFEETAFGEALASYGARERRFGRTSEQLATAARGAGVRPAVRPSQAEPAGTPPPHAQAADPDGGSAAAAVPGCAVPASQPVLGRADQRRARAGCARMGPARRFRGAGPLGSTPHCWWRAHLPSWRPSTACCGRPSSTRCPAGFSTASPPWSGWRSCPPGSTSAGRCATRSCWP